MANHNLGYRERKTKRPHDHLNHRSVALGRNLVENLKAIKEGKNRTKPTLSIQEIYEYDRDSAIEQLVQYCEGVNFIVQVACVKRHKETSEFMECNFGFTSILLDCLKKRNNKAP